MLEQGSIGVQAQGIYFGKQDKNNTITYNISILSKQISDILINPEFIYLNAPITPNTMKNLQIEELKKIYNFLIMGIVEFNESIKKEKKSEKPTCPVISPNHQSMADFKYKQDMINYISNFNFILSDFACKYKTAFLESFAKYCEYKVNKTQRNSSKT